MSHEKNSGILQLLNDPKDILSCLTFAAQKKTKVSLFMKTDCQLLGYQLIQVLAQDQAFILRSDEKIHSLKMEAISPKTDPGDCYVTIPIKTAKLFFKTHVKQELNQGLILTLPTRVYELQRRNKCRAYFKTHHLVKVHFINHNLPLSTQEHPTPFKSHSTTQRLVDIGIGGIAFLISDQEVSYYQPGQILQRISFSIQDHLIRTEGTIKYVKVLSDGSKMAQVGIQFKSLNQLDYPILLSYILDESRKVA